jgi:hypothetical protein
MDLKNGQNTGEVEHLRQSGKVQTKKRCEIHIKAKQELEEPSLQQQQGTQWKRK